MVGARDTAGREEFRLYFDAAIDVPGPQTQRLGEAVAAHGSYVIGVVERDLGTCYCTVLFFGPDGRLLGKHRKLIPTALERMIWGFGDGSTLTAVDSPYGRIGSVICWENYMPMLRMAMYAKNIALYCAPTADDRGAARVVVDHPRGRPPRAEVIGERCSACFNPSAMRAWSPLRATRNAALIGVP